MDFCFFDIRLQPPDIAYPSESGVALFLPPRARVTVTANKTSGGVDGRPGFKGIPERFL